jgi:hypothetical protein
MQMAKSLRILTYVICQYQLQAATYMFENSGGTGQGGGGGGDRIEDFLDFFYVCV